MTENEVKTIDDCLKELKDHRDVYLKRSTPWRIVNRAVRLIEELKLYREIGTVEELQNMKDHLLMVKGMCKDYYEIGTIEECRVAVERMKPKKAVGLKNNICPTCSWIVDGANEHCEKCGQAIDY